MSTPINSSKLHYNGTRWAACKANKRPCRFKELTFKARKNKTPIPANIPNLHMLRADTHELLCAEAIRGKPYQETDFKTNQQKAQYLRRAASQETLIHLPNGAAMFTIIEAYAKRTAEMLPKPAKEVYFSERSAIAGEVYDIKYASASGEIKLSCKLAEMEDKSYRFSTTANALSTPTAFLQQLFSPSTTTPNLTYLETLTDKGFTVHDLQNKMTDILFEIIQNPNHQDHANLKKLTLESFIGKGNYYKTLPDGSVIHYPANLNNITTLTLSKANKTAFHTVEYQASGLGLAYELSFRTKLKDGKNSIVKYSSTNVPTGVGATVKMTVVPTSSLP